jgi:hypothetical protein
MARAPIEEREGVKRLAEALGLASDAGPEILVTRLRERAQALKAAETRLLLLVHSLEGMPVAPEDVAKASTAVLLVDGKPTGLEVESFKSSIEEGVNGLLVFRKALVENQATLEKLSVRVIELEARVDATFGPEGIAKASEVDRNLEDAAKIITLMRARASELLQRSRQLLMDLVQATHTDDGTLRARSERRESSQRQTEEEAEEPEEVSEPRKEPAKTRGPARPPRRPASRPPASPAPPTEFEP